MRSTALLGEKTLMNYKEPQAKKEMWIFIQMLELHFGISIKQKIISYSLDY